MTNPMTAQRKQPIPDCLDGIYSRLGEWNEYKLDSYRKRPCMIRHRTSGREVGPCWPNAGKFVHLSTGVVYPQRHVSHIAYFETDEEQPNERTNDE